jgi:hypothetical protein
MALKLVYYWLYYIELVERKAKKITAVNAVVASSPVFLKLKPEAK